MNANHVRLPIGATAIGVKLEDLNCIIDLPCEDSVGDWRLDCFPRLNQLETIYPGV